MSASLQPTPTRVNVQDQEPNSGEGGRIEWIRPPQELAYYMLVPDSLRRAEERRAQTLSCPSWIEYFKDIADSPWAPPPYDIPDRYLPAADTKPFRSHLAPDDAYACALRLAQIQQSEVRYPLTRWTTVFSYKLPITDLAPELEGLNILQISDIHFKQGRQWVVREVEAVAAWLETRAPRIDMILSPGDFITIGPEDLCDGAINALGRIGARAPVVLWTRANHDYYRHTPELISSQLNALGIKDITNHTVRLSIDGAPITIAGVDDSTFGNPVAPTELPRGELNIVLTHNLDAITDSCSPNAHLILSGHTHGGEFRFAAGRCRNFIKMWGCGRDLNDHIRGFDYLRPDSLAHVDRGLSRYYVQVPWLRYPPGVTLLSLTRNRS